MKHASLYVPLLTLFVWLSGCGGTSSSAHTKAFESASPELKESWAKVQTAEASKDYVTAIMTLRTMLPRDLTKEQRAAVENAMNNCDSRLTKAANGGDAAAQKALETLSSPASSRGR